MHKIELEQFQGPLDLLLQLIEKNKLQITEISLAKVTDQYLGYIEKASNLASTEVADFLLIASKLIYLKSKYLLPDLELEDEDGASDLESQLKIYRQYYEASHVINKMFLTKKKYSYPRIGAYKFPVEKGFAPPTNADTKTMKQIFADVLSKIERVVNLPKAVIAKAVSIGEKIKNIQSIIKEKGNINFNSLLRKKDKTETVVNFLAMLELIKQREINVLQDDMFGDLNISRNHK